MILYSIRKSQYCSLQIKQHDYRKTALCYAGSEGWVSQYRKSKSIEFVVNSEIDIIKQKLKDTNNKVELTWLKNKLEQWEQK